MRILKTAGFAAILTGLAVSGAAFAGATRAGDQNMASGDDKKCAVKVDRTQEAGTYDVTRQVLENGDCICYVYTGPKPQSDTIERAIADLQERRECRDAKVMIIPPAGGAAAAAGGAAAGGAAAGGAAAGGVGGAAIGVGAAAAAAAAGVAASSSSPDSP